MELRELISELRVLGVKRVRFGDGLQVSRSGLQIDITEIELFETAPVAVTEEQVRDAIMGAPPEPKDPRLCGYAGCESETDSNFRTGYCMVHTLKEAGVR